MGKSKDLATGETRFVNTAGDTMTGNLGIGIGSDSAQGTLDVRGAIVTSNSTTSYWKLDRDDSTGSFTINDTGANNRMLIDTSGNVTMPNQPSFRAYINGGNPTITSNPTKIPYNAVRWDIGNNFDETNHRYIAPVAGVYHFTVNHNVYGLSDDQYFRTRIYVNASDYAILGYIRARGGGDHTLNDSILINLSVADTVEVYTSSADTSYSLSASNNWNSFSGFLVG